MAIIKNPGGAIGGGGGGLYLHYIGADFSGNTGHFQLNLITKSPESFTPEKFYNYLVNMYNQNEKFCLLLATGSMTLSDTKYRIDRIGYTGYQIFIHGYTYDGSNAVNHSIAYTAINAPTFLDYIHEII